MENSTTLRFRENSMMCLQEYFAIYNLRMAIYCKNHENILVSMGKNHHILEILEGWGSLGGAELLPLWAFFGIFCKISTPATNIHASKLRFLAAGHMPRQL